LERKSRFGICGFDFKVEKAAAAKRVSVAETASAAERALAVGLTKAANAATEALKKVAIARKAEEKAAAAEKKNAEKAAVAEKKSAEKAAVAEKKYSEKVAVVEKATVAEEAIVEEEIEVEEAVAEEEHLAEEAVVEEEEPIEASKPEKTRSRQASVDKPVVEKPKRKRVVKKKFVDEDLDPQVGLKRKVDEVVIPEMPSFTAVAEGVEGPVKKKRIMRKPKGVIVLANTKKNTKLREVHEDGEGDELEEVIETVIETVFYRGISEVQKSWFMEECDRIFERPGTVVEVGQLASLETSGYASMAVQPNASVHDQELYLEAYRKLEEQHAKLASLEELVGNERVTVNWRMYTVWLQ
jgi:hypothetical protein